jgi:outer membrane receptor for ferrienterochelin and colicins
VVDMKLHRWMLAALALGAFMPATWAQDPAPAETEADAAAEEEQERVEDVIVVTASRTEQRLQEVPVAMTVITAEQLATTPADNYGDVLRSVPGLNVSQISARDIQISGRGATSSLSTDQLVLLDGRSVYLDFFGFVMWDLLPVDFREVAQIEVVRGAGSAVWGANAMGGVINLITKSPWELTGTNAQLGAGERGTLFGSITHGISTEEWGLKLSGSYYEQDAFDRPTGLVPGTTTPYPPFANSGTKQPKFDVRLDRNVGEDSIVSLSIGSAGTDGIVHSGIGPFDLKSSSRLDYAKASWAKGALNVNFFANLLDGTATNLLTVGLDGRPLEFVFESQTYNLDAGNTNIIGANTITYGGNARLTQYDLSIARSDSDRQEFGLYLQDEIELGEHFRWLVGARWDDIDPIGSVVSPRTSLLYSPSDNHNFRISYNKAFRAPSLVENYLDTAIVNAVTLPVVGTYYFPTLSLGNPNLKEEEQTSYEVGYVGNIRPGTTMTLAVYRNERQDETDFYQAAAYTAANPPPGWPLPAIFLAVPPLAGRLPAVFTYRNIGEKINKGVEFSLDYRPNLTWRANFNYSWQDDPELKGINESEVNKPPTHRANLQLGYSSETFFFDTTVNYVDDAFWTDVLDARFHGPTDSYTSLNLTVGYHFNDNVTFSVIGSNVTDEQIQQHVFGDIISRRVSGQLRLSF